MSHLHYIGGFSDAEATFGAYGSSPIPYIEIPNTNQAIVRHIAKSLACFVDFRIPVYQKHDKRGFKTIYRIQFLGSKAAIFARILEPFLRGKKKQAGILSDWKHEYSIQNSRKLRQLNGRGTKV